MLRIYEILHRYWSNTYYVGLISTVVSMNKVLQLSIMPFNQSSLKNMGWIKSKVTLPSLHKVYTQTFPRWLVSGLRKPRDIRVSQPNSPGNSPNVSSTIRLWNLSSLICYWVQADYFNPAFSFQNLLYCLPVKFIRIRPTWNDRPLTLNFA